MSGETGFRVDIQSSKARKNGVSTITVLNVLWLQRYGPLGFLGDSQFLVRWDHENLHSTVSRTDFPSLVSAFPVSLAVDLDAESLQTLAGALANHWGVLADPCREDQGHPRVPRQAT